MQLLSQFGGYQWGSSQFYYSLAVRFDMAVQKLTTAWDQIKISTYYHPKEIEYVAVDYRLLGIGYLWLKICPNKLQRRFVGPFKIAKRLAEQPTNLNSLKVRLWIFSVSYFVAQVMERCNMELPLLACRHGKLRKNQNQSTWWNENWNGIEFTLGDSELTNFR